MGEVTASERLVALGELRPLLGSLGALARHALGDAIGALEAELREDVAELRRLHEASSTDAVRDLIQGQVSAIEEGLSGPSSDGAAADDEGEGASAVPPAKKPAPPPPPAAAKKEWPVKEAPQAAKATAAPSAAAKKPSTDTPEGGFDPLEWPVVTNSLEPEYLQYAHGPLRAVPRCPFGSKAARTLIEQRKPVILTEVPTAPPISHHIPLASRHG